MAQHISQALTVTTAEMGRVVSLNAVRNSLEPEEQKIVELKYAAKPFGLMPAEDVFKAAWAVLVKLHVITGWNIPPDEAIQNELVKQFSLKLVESYSLVNAEEMEYAFRHNTEVKDWGKAMNLNLIDEVMTPYLAKRFDVSRIEEQQKQKALPASAPEVVPDDAFIHSVYVTYKASQRMQSIPELAFKILEKELALTSEEKKTIMEKINAGCDASVSTEQRKLLARQYAVAAYFETRYGK